ncbi:MICOS complex subunit MIC10 [Triplophysa tibetana]|uniref:MICOS complex subunit MIC10 n=1 Tax=Triplophysa tibetana TaxID=1572043 RepID=A0A5A9N9I2_9TELE|nr:MICOS complex subunit MIC10 [Triplophysa tibetana]
MSEKEVGQKWDRCLADCAVKFGTGLGVGIVFSVVFFKLNVHKVALKAQCSDTLNARLLSMDLGGTLKWRIQGLGRRGEQPRRQPSYL